VQEKILNLDKQALPKSVSTQLLIKKHNSVKQQYNTAKDR